MKCLQWASGVDIVRELSYDYVTSLKVGGCDEAITDKALVTTQNSSSHKLPASDRQSLSLQSLG